MDTNYGYVEPPAESLVNLNTKNPTKHGWEQPYTLHDAYMDRPPIEYVVNGLFSIPSVNIVYGPPGSMKSFVCADLGISVASGEKWLSLPKSDKRVYGFVTKVSPVVWIDFDMGSNRTHERIAALARSRRLPADTPFFYYSMPTPTLEANKPESMKKLREIVGDLKAKLAFIDNLGTVSGGVDENSGGMIGVMANFRLLAEDLNSSICIIHHERKTSGGNGRTGDSLRGHSSIEASLDLALLVERDDGSASITLKSTKTRGVDVAPFGATFTYENDKNENLYSARFFGNPILDITSPSAIEREICKALKGNVMNQSEIIKTVKPNLNAGEMRIIGILDKMEISKKFIIKKGEHNAKFYELADSSFPVSPNPF